MDGGRMEVASQLTFLEDSPSSMFMARAGPSTRGRAFAPLASQKWVLRGPTTTVVHEVEGGHNDMNDAVQIQTLLLGTGQAGGTPVEDAQTGARQRKGRGGWGIAAAAGRLSKSHGQVGQKACFQRIRSFVVACFSRKEEFPLPPGRFGPDLVARLLELEAFAGAFENLGSSTASDLLANLGLSLACRPVPSQLQPYRSLDVSRLRLHGTGAWQIAPFLEGSLWLPFLEPGILRHGLPLGSKDLPDFEKEDAEEHLKLALLWDARTLLHLVPPLPIGERSCRIFNSYKSAEADRQIGDRRPANRAELHLTGPSQWLPQGSLFAAYRLPRRKAQITAFVSDRCDFYHQIAVTEARAGCNRLPFAYPREAFQGTAALAAVEARLGPHDAGQGDHLGVEFALEGHAQLLLSHGALRPAHRVMGSSMLPLGLTWQALVIDDLVNVTALPAGADPSGPSEARDLHEAAAQVYEAHRVMGSPDKDVLGSPLFQAVGAEVDSRKAQVSRACVPVAAPLARRVALSVLSLRAARLPITSAKLLTRLSGAWVDDSLAHSLWLNGDRRGGYSRLSVGATAVLRALGEECSEEVLGPPPGLESVPPSLPFVLDLIEIGHPLGPISAEAARIGLRVGPPIHREGSPHYDLLDPDFFVWFYAVLKEGRVLSVAIHPPSSPLSQLSRPTKGHSRTLRESRAVALAARCLLFFRCAVRLACPALVLTPALSSLCQWQSWKRTATTPQVLRLQLCLCAYGGRPGKVVSILAFGVHFGALARSCCCLATEHRVAVPCQGHLPTGLSAAIAEVFFTARRADLEKKSPRPALESVVVNDLLLTRPWRVRKVLKWKGSHHINVLELASLGALLRELASTSRDSRFSVFLDSAVAKAAAAKGRSTSYALAPGLARACSLQLAFGLYMSLGFAPTRLNIADDPTRHFAMCCDLVKLLAGAFVTSTPPLATRARDLDFLLSLLALLWARAPLQAPPFCTDLWTTVAWALPIVSSVAWISWPFDSSLGFPGEGWDFELWLREQGRASVKSMLQWPLDRTEEISYTLVDYGRSLFRTGAAYYRYSETINAIASARPGIRRHLGAAWDLAFAWLSEEPHAHHRALPKGALLAILAASLAWGWLREAAIFGLAWAGLLRIGEALGARRRDLILPRDASPGTEYALLQIATPKTRGRAAKHQAAHIDPPDIIRLLDIAFGELPRGAKLWPFSAGTLRRRFKTLQERFGLCSARCGAHFDLASFRPGGRWLSTRVMEIYLQEVQACDAFPYILAKAAFFVESHIPPQAWWPRDQKLAESWQQKRLPPSHLAFWSGEAQIVEPQLAP
ncbi:hypothetical protein AK812_SmicGene42412 [Symbiodinium microadriaticum]|uniref:Tyr recombinase domain-containing protein n=1 Tax=Symbiodinium microadriaticum TaxID=2951 RepID=A0A1Q9C3M1_SYMMI|nr:hypothetical protein AK812_SmicGene42412 [Symbiodinium microadriaticum]